MIQMASNPLKFWPETLKEFIDSIHEDIVYVSCTMYSWSIMINLTEDSGQLIGKSKDRPLTLLQYTCLVY